MLSRAAADRSVARGLTRHKAHTIVLDPVMVATSGDKLLAPVPSARCAACSFPRALIVMPILPEAAALTGASLARNEREMKSRPQILELGRVQRADQRRSRAKGAIASTC